MQQPWRAISSRAKEAVSISLMGEAASLEKPVNSLRRSAGFWSVFHRVRVVEPRVIRSPTFTSFRS